MNTISGYLDSLSDSEVEEIFIELVGYAERRLNYIDSVAGISGEDFVNTVIVKSLDEDAEDHRKWDVKKTPDPLDFLKSAVSSEISNHFNLKSTKTTTTANPVGEEKDFFDLLLGDDSLGVNYPYEEFRDKVFDEVLKTDEQLAELFIYEESGFEMNEIISDLGFKNNKDVYNARKRLRRAIENAFNKMKKGGDSDEQS